MNTVQQATTQPSTSASGASLPWDGTTPYALHGTGWSVPDPTDDLLWWEQGEWADPSPDNQDAVSPPSSGHRPMPSASRSVRHATQPYAFRQAVYDALDVHGFLTTPQLAAITGFTAGDKALEKRLRREVAAGRVEVTPIKTSGRARTPCWTLSKKAVESRSSSLGYVRRVAPTTAKHHLVSAQVTVELQTTGLMVATERQLRAAEVAYRDAAGYRVIAGRFGERKIRVMPDGARVRYSDSQAILEWHRAYMPPYRPDLRTTSPTTAAPAPPPVRFVAWEIELSHKRPHLIEAKLAYYETSSTYERVVYLCANDRIADLIDRAWTAAAPLLDLRIKVLDRAFVDAATSRHAAARHGSLITPQGLRALAT